MSLILYCSIIKLSFKIQKKRIAKSKKIKDP